MCHRNNGTYVDNRIQNYKSEVLLTINVICVGVETHKSVSYIGWIMALSEVQRYLSHFIEVKL